jgi:hypothetical protein
VLEAGVTPVGIMPQADVVAAINAAVQFVGIGTDEADSVISFIISFGVLNTASDRVLQDTSLDKIYPLYTSDGTEHAVNVIQFFTAVFPMSTDASPLRRFIRAFPERTLLECISVEAEMSSRFGINDFWAARGDLFPKGYIEQNRYNPERLGAAKARKVVRGVEHPTYTGNGGGVTTETGY